MEYVTCNLCESNSSIKLFKISSFEIVKCKNCNLIYVNPRLNQKELKKIYAGNYFTNPHFYEDGLGHYGYDKYFFDKDNIQENFTGRSENISNFVKTGNLLDIGCAAGFFLDLARSRGWKTEGIEFSKEAVEFAKNKLKLNVKRSDISKIQLRKNYYNLITMFDVIEHISDPKAVLKKINKALKLGGLLVITTPDVGSVLARFMGKNWPEFKRVREHIYFFSEDTLTNMLNKVGFKVIKKETTGRNFNLLSALEYVNAYNKTFKSFEAAIKFMKLDKIKIHINPGYKMTVYASKISNSD